MFLFALPMLIVYSVFLGGCVFKLFSVVREWIRNI